jgi:tRNA/tmRNA/rRNA uracil-C5-methylase (TrmA/RlmC/RlmD family)
MTDRAVAAPESLVGSVVEVDVGNIAHGGHHVARHEGRVIFVRHAITSERVRVLITEGASDSRFLRGDAIQVITASPDRVEAPCPYAAPGACGGCDFQHVTLARQRQQLGDVIREQLQRLAGLDWNGEVEAIDGDSGGLGWRTRVRYSATQAGRPGLLKHRSTEVIPVTSCLIAHEGLPSVEQAMLAGATSATAVVSATGEQAVVTDARTAPPITERASGRSWRVSAGDFWQVHPGAADALVSAVLDGVRPVEGDRCWDLYAGVGLFSGALAPAVGDSGAVLAVEAHRRAADHLRHNLADLQQVRPIVERVDRFVRGRTAQGRLDIVVLDPPRAGAGKAIVQSIAARNPRVVAYVACDPAALARDLATFVDAGYRLGSLRAFDIFPMTHHVECVAILVR